MIGVISTELQQRMDIGLENTQAENSSGKLEVTPDTNRGVGACAIAGLEL